MTGHEQPAAYTPPEGIRSLQTKLVANSNGARLEPEWGEVRALMRERDSLHSLVRRFREWDDLPGRADGPYWMREADEVLGAE